MAQTKVELVNRDKYTCTYVNGTAVVLRNKQQLRKLRDELLTFCADNDWLPMMVSAMMAFCLLTATCSIIYRNQYLYYLKYQTQIWFNKHKNTYKEAYKYTAFVCYDESDEEWVLEKLAPHMENEKDNIHLCLHKRDFRPGELITECIARHMCDSRKVVLVLSGASMKSAWPSSCQSARGILCNTKT